jgi:uncharacterized phage protein (TIGR02220 family)
MAKDPAFLFYSNDFLSGTYTMTDAQVGKYIRLMCLQHQQGHLSETDMLTVCQKHDAKIWSKFKKDEQGMYYNERLDAEISKRQAHSQKQRENVQKRWKKNTTVIPPYQSGITTVIPLENENENVNRDVKDIISYLNEVAGTKYRTNSKTTVSHIQARLKEGFTVEDFKTVTDKQWAKWRGTEFEQYMRPQTLFGTKFESYLNSTAKQTTGNVFLDLLKEESG